MIEPVFGLILFIAGVGISMYTTSCKYKALREKQESVASEMAQAEEEKHRKMQWAIEDKELDSTIKKYEEEIEAMEMAEINMHVESMKPIPEKSRRIRREPKALTYDEAYSEMESQFKMNQKQRAITERALAQVPGFNSVSAEVVNLSSTSHVSAPIFPVSEERMRLDEAEHRRRTRRKKLGRLCAPPSDKFVETENINLSMQRLQQLAGI